MSSWLAGLRSWRFALALALGAVGMLWVIPALAQQPSKLGIAKATSSAQPTPPAKPVEEPSEPAPPGSPRGAVQQYLELSRKGRFQEAGALLDVPASREAERAQLAKRLSAVLNRYVWIDLDKLSEREDGALADGLPPRYEQVGSIPA